MTETKTEDDRLKIDWRMVNKVPLGIRRDVLRAALELRRDRAIAALNAIQVSVELEVAGCESAYDAFAAAKGAIRDYAFDEAFELALNEVFRDGLNEGFGWAQELAAELGKTAPVTGEGIPF